MRSLLVLAVLAVLCAGALGQDAPPPAPLLISPAPLKLNICRNFGELVGFPVFDGNSTSERNCFFKCDNNNANYYTYDTGSKRCACFKPGNVTNIVPNVQSTVIPIFDYYVYGSIQACFPYCSNGVSSCSRCNIKVPKGEDKPFCIKNFSRMRCCCYPPSKVFVKKGKIVGCTKTGPAR